MGTFGVHIYLHFVHKHPLEPPTMQIDSIVHIVHSYGAFLHCNNKVYIEV